MKNISLSLCVISALTLMMTGSAGAALITNEDEKVLRLLQKALPYGTYDGQSMGERCQVIVDKSSYKANQSSHYTVRILANGINISQAWYALNVYRFGGRGDCPRLLEHSKNRLTAKNRGAEYPCFSYPDKSNRHLIQIEFLKDGKKRVNLANANMKLTGSCTID